jgi:hypothetical protein
MIENTSSAVIETTTSDPTQYTLKAILFGGLTVGVLDCLAASSSALIKGRSPAVVWQYVASGLLGKDSYSYGWMTVVLGLLLHFFIAFSVATVYYLASRRFPILVRQAILCGALYGIAVYFFMAYVVSPLSATAQLPFSLSGMVTGILIHIFCVGLPAALIARQFTKADN